jgi:hypothetical protein
MPKKPRPPSKPKPESSSSNKPRITQEATMDSAAPANTPKEKPLDAKRAELRAKGWNDDQITKILMDAEAQALAQPQAAAAAAGVGGLGVMSGVLSSLVVASLLVKAAVVGVLGFASGRSGSSTTFTPRRRRRLRRGKPTPKNAAPKPTRSRKQ